mgnify:CR=1 FL=1
MKEYFANYYQENKEKIKSMNNIYKAQNKEKIKAMNNIYKAENKEKIKLTNKIYRKNYNKLNVICPKCKILMLKSSLHRHNIRKHPN